MSRLPSSLKSILSIFFFLFGAQMALADTPTVLRVSAIPDEAPTELQRKAEPLMRYLEKQLGVKVKYVPVVDYAATVEGLAAKKLDLVWYGGFTFVQARKRTGNAIPLVMRIEDANFHSKFIAYKDSGIKRLEDLKGKTFAFGSVGSTSGHLMPRYFLLQHHIVPERDFAKFSFSGSHDATAKWVEAGRVQAGVLNESVWEKLVESGKVDVNKVKVIWTTPAYVDYNWTVRGDLDRMLMTRITRAFLNLDHANPEHRKIMDLQRARGYVIATPDDFKGVEAAAKAAKLLQ
ncbi:MAG: putative selenate ABC transporter substrate-binding protein [Candidatus Tectomicrobia bacterium]|nr:putative selenate ABC transporter substrate-binding protein [Candidatus Tectomicrobia bacterium]